MGEPEKSDPLRVLVPVGLAGLTIALLAAWSSEFQHWFVLPVAICGALVGVDATDWIRGRLDVYDPAGVLGLLGVHFFFLAPLLHVGWDHWMQYVVPPPDWRDWLGAMACLNIAGLILYRWALTRTAERDAPPIRPLWQHDVPRFRWALGVALLVSLGGQGWLMLQMGGIAGSIETFERGQSAFEGMGWQFMIAEAFPFLAFMGYACAAARSARARTWPALAVALVAFLGVKFLFGGLRGSRSNTVWGLFWAVGVVHLSLRRIPRISVYAGVLVLLAFMYFYGFFKSAGIEGLWQALESPVARESLESQTRRTFAQAVLHDLGRSDVQACVLYRVRPDANPELGYGRTYLGALALGIPRSIWPDRPLTKVREGTLALYSVDRSWATNVYGLAGEAMLNFGPFGAPIPFLVLGWCVGRLRRFSASLAPGDARWLLVPFFTILCIQLLVMDSDVVFYYSITFISIPFLVVFLGVRRNQASVLEWT